MASRSWPKVQRKVYRGDSGALPVLLPQIAPMLARVLVQAVTLGSKGRGFIDSLMP